MNEFIFFGHTILISLGALAALRLGKASLVTFICLLSTLSNLFITKQISLFGCAVTGGEVFAVGAIFGLNLLQEFFGKTITQKTIQTNFFVLFFYLIMSQIHLWYTPNQWDTMHIHFAEILTIMPRITLASITTYCIVQWVDAHIYYLLHRFLKGRYLYLRSTSALIVSQFLDTTIFTYLGLYGVITSPLQVITVSMIIKLTTITLTTPFILLAKKLTPSRNNHE